MGWEDGGGDTASYPVRRHEMSVLALAGGIGGCAAAHSEKALPFRDQLLFLFLTLRLRLGMMKAQPPDENRDFVGKPELTATCSGRAAELIG